jgi:hypothetical protein
MNPGSAAFRLFSGPGFIPVFRQIKTSGSDLHCGNAHIGGIPWLVINNEGK